MSGGQFRYDQHRILQMWNDIEQFVLDNDSEAKNEFGDSIGRRYTEETINEFKQGIAALKKAYVYAQRIDWLLSGDDGEDGFHKRLAKELEEL